MSKSKMSKDTVNMQIPQEFASQLEVYLCQLQHKEVDDGFTLVNTENSQPEPETHQPEEIEFKELEVESVLNHTITKHGFIFNIKFKGIKNTDWIKDDDCDCEYLISKYLNEKNIKTAYLICRVSTKEQTSCTSTSLEAQEDELKKALIGVHYIYDRIKVYKISSSAYKNVPRVLMDLEQCLYEGDSLWVWRVDRLSRNIIKYIDLLERLDNNNVDINAYTETMNYRKNKLDFIQKIVDAQKESHAIGERVKLSYKMKRDRGDEAVGGLPFGKKYKNIFNQDKTKVVRKIVVINDEENNIIQLVKNSTMSLSDLVIHLNNSGITKRGRKWTLSMVMRIKQ